MEKVVITEKRYQEDLSRGYAILQWQPRGSKRTRDLRTGRIVEVRRAPMTFYRCMNCQFDAHDEKLMGKHLANGEHPWAYADGDTPYGPMYRVEFEGGLPASVEEIADESSH